MKKAIAFTLLVLLALPVLGLLFWQYLPYQAVAAAQIRSQLAARGLKAEALTVVSLTSAHAELADIRLEGGLSARKVSADYDFGGLKRLEAEGVAATLYREREAWRVGGLENMQKGGGALPQVAVRDVTVTVKGVGRDDLVLKIPSAEARDGALTLQSVATKWGGGEISAGELRIPPALDKPVRVALAFKAVNLAQLLDEAAQGKVKGTGRVSGTLPVIWYPGGRIDLAGGAAKALEAGTLSISGEALPENLAEVRAALANFQYNSLDMKFDWEGDETVIRLTVEGSSPDAFQGRPVKLNVNLRGDIVPLLRQTVSPIADPRYFLNESK